MATFFVCLFALRTDIGTRVDFKLRDFTLLFSYSYIFIFLYNYVCDALEYTQRNLLQFVLLLAHYSIPILIGFLYIQIYYKLFEKKLKGLWIITLILIGVAPIIECIQSFDTIRTLKKFSKYILGYETEYLYQIAASNILLALALVLFAIAILLKKVNKITKYISIIGISLACIVHLVALSSLKYEMFVVLSLNYLYYLGYYVFILLVVFHGSKEYVKAIAIKENDDVIPDNTELYIEEVHKEASPESLQTEETIEIVGEFESNDKRHFKFNIDKTKRKKYVLICIIVCCSLVLGNYVLYRYSLSRLSSTLYSIERSLYDVNVIYLYGKQKYVVTDSKDLNKSVLWYADFTL